MSTAPLKPGDIVRISDKAVATSDRNRIAQIISVDYRYETARLLIPNPPEEKGVDRRSDYHLSYLEPVHDRRDLMQAISDDIPDASPMEKAGLDLADRQVKDSNPKDGCGAKKPPLSYIPRPVLYEVGNALFEGSRKYGAFNWRIAGVRASIYQDACGRHLDAWVEGQDLDPDSGIHHISKAIAGLIVIRDAMICDKFVDDRPPSAPADWMEKAQAQTDAIIERHPTSKAPYTQIRKDAGAYDDMV